MIPKNIIKNKLHWSVKFCSLLLFHIKPFFVQLCSLILLPFYCALPNDIVEKRIIRKKGKKWKKRKKEKKKESKFEIGSDLAKIYFAIQSLFYPLSCCS